MTGIIAGGRAFGQCFFVSKAAGVHAEAVLDLVDRFILHLATERGLSVSYQILVRGFLEAFASWFKEAHGSENPSR